jgi:branched-chain amino acid transport system ATP-binding protein
MLDVGDLYVYYDGVAALKGVSLSVSKGELVALIGSNGAGKSTILRTISGLKKPMRGEIRFNGRRIDGLSANKVAEYGIAHIPEGRRIFPYMSVFENLKMGAYLRNDQQSINRDYEMVYDHFPRLKERQRQLGHTLSGGEQQMLAIGRALMANPRMLLMDEPSLGLSPLLCQELSNIILRIRDQLGVSILLVEQNARLALQLATRGYVLVTGEILIEGSSMELINSEAVRKAYLGM